MTKPESSPNAFERDKPGTNARTEAEAAIEDLRQRGGVFVEAVRATRMPMALTDPNLPGNPIVFANESFLKLSGYSMDEVLGQQPHFMNGPGTDPRDSPRFVEMLRSEQDEILETVQYRKDGSLFVATVLVSAFKDDEGKVLNHFMSWLDVTRRADAEQEVAELKSIQTALRHSEERQAFLLELGDATRAASTAEAKIEVAARMLGERLDASRVLWAEYDWERNLARILNGWFADGAQPFPSVMQLADYEGEVLNQLKAGRTVRVDNVGSLTGEPAYAAIANVGVQALLSSPLLVGGTLKVNLSIHQHKPRHWTDDEVALVEEVSERLWAEVVRARAEGALRASEVKYRTLFATMGQGYCEIELLHDEEGRAVDQLYLELNPAFERLFGIKVAEAKGRKASEVFPYIDPTWHERFDEVARTGAHKRFEHQHGPLQQWFEVFAYPAGGDRIIVLYDEITDRKRAEEAMRASEQRARLLLAELQHRVRNILSMIRSVARRTAETTETIEDYVQHFEGRINAMAHTQALLTRGIGAEVDLQNLILDELETQTAQPEQYRLTGPDIALPPKAAEVLGLALHELATNSVKYGALSCTDGRLDVRWALLDGDETPQLDLVWSESGVDLSNHSRRQGFGTELITYRVPYELHGTGTMEFTPEGLVATIKFPLTKAPSTLQTDEGSRR